MTRPTNIHRPPGFQLEDQPPKPPIEPPQAPDKWMDKHPWLGLVVCVALYLFLGTPLLFIGTLMGLGLGYVFWGL